MVLNLITKKKWINILKNIQKQTNHYIGLKKTENKPNVDFSKESKSITDGVENARHSSHYYKVSNKAKEIAHSLEGEEPEKAKAWLDIEKITKAMGNIMKNTSEGRRMNDKIRRMMSGYMKQFRRAIEDIKR